VPLLLLIGCRDVEDQVRHDSPSGPELVALDSLRLPEAGSLYVGRPRGILVSPVDGSFFIADLFSHRVLRFRRDGSLVRIYGRRGQGPGELETAGATFLLDDTTLVVHDTRMRRLNLFDTRTGAFRSDRELPMLVGTSVPVVRDDGVWFPVADPGQSNFASVARWDLQRDSVAYLGPMPAEYRESIEGGNWIYANALLQGVLAVRGDTLVRGWMNRNELVLLALDGNVLDTLRLPVVRRRGVPADIREQFDVDLIGFRERLELNSGLMQLHVLPDGGLAFTHHDRQVLTLTPMPTMAAEVWVGVLFSDLSEACVGAKLPVSMDARSMEAFRGDTLFQLDRRIVGNRLETWIRTFLVDTSHCDWLPVSRAHDGR
jgi:hypothetical protein